MSNSSNKCSIKLKKKLRQLKTNQFFSVQLRNPVYTNYWRVSTWEAKIVFVLQRAGKPLRSAKIVEVLEKREVHLRENTQKQDASAFLDMALKADCIKREKRKGERDCCYLLPWKYVPLTATLYPPAYHSCQKLNFKAYTIENRWAKTDFQELRWFRKIYLEQATAARYIKTWLLHIKITPERPLSKLQICRNRCGFASIEKNICRVK